MQHPFEVLKSEYEALLSRADIIPSREKELNYAVTKVLFPHKDLYKAVEEKTGVPAAFTMALAMREMSGNINRYLGNGQSLSRVTTIVPKGRGPFFGPDAFVRGAADAFAIDGLDKKKDWTMARICYEGENWNGWGYRNPSINIPTPYLWGATTVQKKGKFIRDHVFDRTETDQQLGMIALIREIFNLDQTLVFAEFGKKEEKAESKTETKPGDKVEVSKKEPEVVVAAAPIGVGGGVNVTLLQKKLNAVRAPGTPIEVTGNYDRETARAVKAYQFMNDLEPDGLVGPKTLRKMGFIK